MKDLFRKYQKPLLKLANNRFGRRLLSINTKEKIVGITDNAFAVEAENKLKAEFRCYPVYAKRIGAALVNWDESKQWLKGNKELYKGLDNYKGLFNYCGILDSREFPAVMAASPDTIYSSAGDGVIGVITVATWAGARGATTGTADYTSDAVYVRAIRFSNEYYINRLFFPFDTSGLGSITVSDAVFSAYCSAYAGDPEPVVAIQTTQASITQLVNDDFNNVSFTAGSNTQTVASTGWKTFTLNETGEGWVSGTAPTLLGIIDNNHDLANSEPPEEAAPTDNATFRFSEYTGTDYDPKLVITYTIPSGFLVFM